MAFGDARNRIWQKPVLRFLYNRFYRRRGHGVNYIIMSDIHIGQLIQQELKHQERTPTWLARKINCERSNIYYIFSQRSINSELLLRLSKALGVNFFKYYEQQLDENRSSTQKDNH